jgi:hypothetical protein
MQQIGAKTATGGAWMRFVALVLAAGLFVGGLGIISVGTAQAHGGAGGGPMDVVQQTCITNPTQATASSDACAELLETGQK